MKRPLRVLCISPRFPPSSAADAQRLRLVLPHFSAVGIDAEILSVDPRCCTEPRDPWQLRRLPSSLKVHRVRGLSTRWSAVPGLGSVESRTLPVLTRAGDRILECAREQGRPFDLAYFSTTAFGSFVLGKRWFQRYKLPFILDYQDPWVNDFYRSRPDLKPPGGRLKYALVHQLQRRREPTVLRCASGITSVSKKYLTDLQSRYSFASAIPSLVLPFPGSPDEFEGLNCLHDAQASRSLPFDPQDGYLHWVSIGRGGADLETALHGLFGAIARFAPDQLKQRLRLHFIGTSYAPAGKGLLSIVPVAKAYGLGDLVSEQPDRLPMGEALVAMLAADALLALGSDDPSYTASKLYPYLLAGKPLLAILHQSSPASALFTACGGGQLVPFDPVLPLDRLQHDVAAAWIANRAYAAPMPLDREAFKPHTASSQAGQLAGFFHDCLAIAGMQPSAI